MHTTGSVVDEGIARLLSGDRILYCLGVGMYCSTVSLIAVSCLPTGSITHLDRASGPSVCLDVLLDHSQNIQLSFLFLRQDLVDATMQGPHVRWPIRW